MNKEMNDICTWLNFEKMNCSSCKYMTDAGSLMNSFIRSCYSCCGLNCSHTFLLSALI